MDSPVLGLLAPTLAFASVSVGTYGLLKQACAMDLLPLRRGDGRTVLRGLSARIGAAATRREWFPALRLHAQQALLRARRVNVSASDVVGTSLMYAVAGGVVGWIVTLAAGGAVYNIVPGLVTGFVIFHVPGWSLKSAARERIAEVTRRLPYSLEVVVLATEAGASFEEALGILVREDPDPPLHEEFDQVLRDMQFGLTRRDALHAMAARTGTDDLASLVMAMDVAEDLGTPVGATLKKQSAAIQVARLRRAERLAQEAGPKMALPNTMIMVANVLLILAPFIPKLALNGPR